jgi:hypothetical protein
MPVKSDTLLSVWDMETMPACDEGMELARRFLEAGECVNTLGHGKDRAQAAMIFCGPITQW